MPDITTDQTIDGLSRITVATDQNIDGVSALVLTTTQDISGVANIYNSNSQTFFGKASILKTQEARILGRSRICYMETEQNQSGVANIHNPNIPEGTYTETMRHPNLGILVDDQVFAWLEAPAGGDVFETPCDIEVTWVFQSQEVADFYAGKTCTIMYSADSGEEWNTIGDNYDLYGGTSVNILGADGRYYPGWVVTIPSSSFGSLTEFYYVKVIINESPTITVMNQTSFTLE